MIKSLIFKGGGVLGIAYAGAIQELESKGVVKNIERVAGTSAGAIVALLLALKYTSAEISNIVSSTDFKSFEDDFSVLAVGSHYGLYRGDVFLEWVWDKMAHKGFKTDTTFSELVSRGCLDLHVFATNLNTQSLTRFSAAETPNVKVAEAVRASMSIPLFFRAFRMTNDTSLYVDGGVLWNYPITCFDTNGVNDETIGLFLTSNSKIQNGLTDGHLIEYVKALAETVLSSQSVDLMCDPEDMKRTIMIDSLGISATNFGLSIYQKQSLFQSGVKAVQLYATPQ